MPTKTARRPLKVARILLFHGHTEFTMVGFDEVEDLPALKSQVPMRWCRDDKVWIVHRRDTDWLIEQLEDLGFIVRVRDERD